MKKYFFALIAGSLALVSLVYLYVRREVALEQHYEYSFKTLLMAKHAEAALEKDVLKSRNYLLSNYDPLVLNEAALNQICGDLRNSQNGVYSKISHDIDILIDSYCVKIETKLSNIEYFKSKNAIFRNSIFFLQKKSTDIIAEKRPTAFTRGEFLQSQLVYGSVTYALSSSNSTSLKVLEQAITETQAFLNQSSHNEELAIVLSHAQKISELSEPLDALTRDIVGTESRRLLEEISEQISDALKSKEDTSNLHLRGLFGTCAVFLVLIVYGANRLWNSAKALAHANATLESRVEERTKELKSSQDTIVLQQQALVSTAKMSALGEMAGGVAHEINNPLAVIKSLSNQLSELIDDELLDKNSIKEMASEIETTTDRIAKIVKGLRTFSRDGSEDPFLKVSIHDLIEETLSFCSERLRNGGVRLTIDDFDKSLSLEGRMTELSQVLLNLLNNAHDAIQNLSEKWIRVSIKSEGNYIKIIVMDSGSGIPARVRDKIFQPFFTTKEIGKGTGMGLSISTSIIKNHYGSLSIEASEPNTCFVIQLPKKQGQELKVA